MTALPAFPESPFLARRLALGLTQDALAARLGLTSRTVRRLEGVHGETLPLSQLYSFALDGLAIELWSEHIRRIGELTLAHAVRESEDRRLLVSRFHPSRRRKESTPCP